MSPRYLAMLGNMESLHGATRLSGKRKTASVTTPLGNNAEHIEQLCAGLELGQPGRELSRLPGGFHHRVWRLETDQGVFAIKQLAPDTDLGDVSVIAHYNVCETVARRFSECGISVVCALGRDGEYLQLLGNEAYLVYPWTNAVALESGKLSPAHALAVARLLATMHGANIQVPGVDAVLSQPQTGQAIEDMVVVMMKRNLPGVSVLSEQLPTLLRIARRHRLALPVIARRQVISHGDLDQKNVLWDAGGNPVLIDWESAHRLNPTYEVILEALDWSGITAEFDSMLFTQFVGAYTEAGGTVRRDIIEAALHYILGEWLGWLMYNVGRLVNLDDGEQRAIGEAQIDFTLPVILRLERLRPSLLDTLARQIGSPRRPA